MITDSKAHLLVIGLDEAGIQPQMEQILENLLERVHFAGFSSHPEKYMAAADVLCLPSYREGFGCVIIEAAAVGIPAIGSRIYGIEDAIMDGVTGLLFEAKDTDALRGHMTTLIADNELRERLGKSARERVLDQFSSEDLASAWLDYYQARL